MMRAPQFAAVVVLVGTLAVGCTDTYDASIPPGSAVAAAPVTDAAGAIDIVDEGAWPMHPIDGRFRGANGLGPGDVDGDGDRDYLTNYEFDQRWVVALHPDGQEEVRASWPTVEIWAPDPLVEGNGKNPESAALGDFDGDGNLDAVGAHGFSDIAAFEGSAPGIHLVWGPERARVTEEDAWIDGGWVPSTIDLGHPHWVAAHDVNADGLVDVTFGGRQHGGGGGYENLDSPNGNGTFTGLGWLEAPADPAQRRDLAGWIVHHIDADEYSGHAFVFADLDGDGDGDIADANADFDTPEDREEVAWYENPGGNGAAVRDEWERRTLLRDPSFYAKPSVAAGDLDGDGRVDLATQTDDQLVLFRNLGGQPAGFETVLVPKPPEAAWRSRGVRLADIDRDGDLDIVAMLIHEDNVLPPDKASVFVLLNEGAPWSASGWRFLPVSWGSGTTMRVPGFGEKWDQADISDVDGDGDLDIVANCEEWWAEPQGEVSWFFTPGLATSSVAVVWFENRLGDEPPVVTEEAGTLELEAERPSTIGDATWVERAPVRGDERGPAAMQALNALQPEGGTLPAGQSRGLAYEVDATGGQYVVWARMFQPSLLSRDVGGDGADSAWLVLPSGATAVIGDRSGDPSDGWAWYRLEAPVDLARGRQQIGLRVREHGAAIDRIVLSADPSFVPS